MIAVVIITAERKTSKNYAAINTPSSLSLAIAVSFSTYALLGIGGRTTDQAEPGHLNGEANMDRISELKGIINRVSFEVGAVRHGVAITLEPHKDFCSFVIWKEINGKTHSEKLRASVTSEARLKAHAEGFIANTLAEERKAANAQISAAIAEDRAAGCEDY